MALVTLPVDAPIAEMFDVVRRDGGIIIRDFLPAATIDAFNSASAPLFLHEQDAAKLASGQALTEMGPDFHASNTAHLRGLLGKVQEPTSAVIMHSVWHALMHEFLGGVTKTYVGNHLLVTKTSYIVSLAAGFQVSPGAGDQVLHRDQSIHSVDAKEGSLYTSDMGCLVAGTRATKANGATRVIPGSHLWGSDRIPLEEEVVPAEMEKGSALFWLGSTYHGAGANTTKLGNADDIRILYGIFGCCDYMRQEESQTLAIAPHLAKTLPREVLRRSGWAKGAGGSGFVNARDPIEMLAL